MNDGVIFTAHFNFTKLFKKTLYLSRFDRYRHMWHIRMDYAMLRRIERRIGDICYRNRIRAGARTHLRQRANMVCNMRAPTDAHKSAYNKGS